MFLSSRNKSYRESFGYRASKTTSRRKDRSFKEKEHLLSQSMRDAMNGKSPQTSPTITTPSSSTPTSPNSSSAVVTISVGPSQRLFAAHENVLCQSDFFADALRKQFFEPGNKRIDLPNEEPEIFSAVLEFMYRGDYKPKLAFNEKRGSWSLEEGAKLPSIASESTIFLPDTERTVLKDTVIYCSAHTYRLPALQRIALKKQGLQCNVGCSTILASARYAYLHTPANDSKLRAHYLALIIRSRHTFKRSGTMQTEMQEGGSPLFFDLFVALVNHLDDVDTGKYSR